jgi:hypothetical protein
MPKLTIRSTMIKTPKIAMPKLGFTNKAKIGSAKPLFSNVVKSKTKLK